MKVNVTQEGGFELGFKNGSFSQPKIMPQTTNKMIMNTRIFIMVRH